MHYQAFPNRTLNLRKPNDIAPIQRLRSMASPLAQEKNKILNVQFATMVIVKIPMLSFSATGAIWRFIRNATVYLLFLKDNGSAAGASG
jgi:uncharacterized membrane protein (DUF106 family)